MAASDSPTIVTVFRPRLRPDAALQESLIGQ